jgi:hypothetical protein
MSSITSDFMINIVNRLVSDKNISVKSADLYLKYLIMLNNKQPFKSLTFLKEKEEIQKKLEKYSDNTKKTILSGVVSVLSLFKDKQNYKSIYKYYFDKMMDIANDMKNNNNENDKTKKQSDNWIDWNIIINMKDRLLEECDLFNVDAKKISPEHYNKILNCVIMSVYTEIPPRRNSDFLNMYVVNGYKDTMDTNKNYYDVINNKFIFNNYKTQKKYGQQIIDISNIDKLKIILYRYMRVHPLNPAKNKKDFITDMPKNTEFKFLVNSDGSMLDSVNSITRVLNKIFNKRLGTSMMRHIYLSSKYDVDEMKQDAEMMGHSLNQQRQYLKSEN